jgi:hypothetical protein
MRNRSAAFGSFVTSSRFRHDDGDIRSHPRLQLQLRIIDSDHDIVGDDILYGRGGIAHLRDFPVEDAVRGMHRRLKSTPWFSSTVPTSASATLVVDLHLREVVRDREEHRRVHRGGDGLAHVYAAGDHCSIDGRAYRAALEINLRLLEVGLLDLQRGLGLSKGGKRTVEIGLRGSFLGNEILLSLAVILASSREDSASATSPSF